MAKALGAKGVACPQRLVELLALKKTGLGTPAIEGVCANMCSIVDLGVGSYRIDFDIPYPSATNIHPVVLSATNDTIARVSAKAVGSVTITTEDLAGSAAEADFELVIVATRARDLIS